MAVPWALLAREGAAGAAGAAGLPGPQGLQGATGAHWSAAVPRARGGYQSFHELGYESGALYLSPLTAWSGAMELGRAIARIPTACTMTLISVFVDSPAAGDEVYTLRAGTTMIVTADGWGSDLTDRDLACTIPRGRADLLGGGIRRARGRAALRPSRRRRRRGCAASPRRDRDGGLRVSRFQEGDGGGRFLVQVPPSGGGSFFVEDALCNRER